MDLHVTALALGAAAGLGLSLVLTQLGLRHLTPLRGACVSVPVTTLGFLALAPVMLDTSSVQRLRGACCSPSRAACSPPR